MSRRDGEVEPHWQNVLDNCEYHPFEPECIEAFYDALGEDNGVEWRISLRQWFNQQPIIAYFGWDFSNFAALCAFYFLIYPDRLPHIDDAPWKNIKPIRGWMIFWTIFTANLMKPDAFFFTQIFTFGESDLRDLEIIYMNPFDAVLYYVMEYFLLPWMQWGSFTWVMTFWWVYLAEFTWWLVEFSWTMLNLFINQYVD